MVRGRENPERWPLKDEENVALPQNVHNSVLRVDAPDFVNVALPQNVHNSVLRVDAPDFVNVALPQNVHNSVLRVDAPDFVNVALPQNIHNSVLRVDAPDFVNVALPQNVHNSVLRVDAPDFVPGQPYFMPERNSKRGDKAEVTTNQQEEAAPTTRDSAEMEEETWPGLMSLAKLLSSLVPELGGEWQDCQEAKQRKGSETPRDHEMSEHAVWESKRKMEKDGKKDTKEVEELDFDEELEQLDGGHCNNFTEWSDESDDDTEFEDKDIDKLLFITQTPPYLRKHPGGDRTGDYQMRAKYISDMSKVSSEGLISYEQELWKDNSMQRRNATIERGEMTFGMETSVPVPWTTIKRNSMQEPGIQRESQEY